MTSFDFSKVPGDYYADLEGDAVVGAGAPRHYAKTAPILAFSGTTSAGKDTSANFAMEFGTGLFFGVRRLSLASSIKSVSHQLFGKRGLQPGPFYDLEENRHLRYEVLPLLGRTPVDVWIMVGDRMRDIHESVWVDQASADSAYLNIESSMRFLTECQWVKSHGGWVVKIIRDGTPVLALDKKIPANYPFDRVIENNGTKEELREKIRALVKEYHAFWLSQRPRSL